MAYRIIYAAPEANNPSGGIRVLYRHAEALMKAGYESLVWQFSKITAPSWFENSAPIVTGESLWLDETDILVIPEVFVFPGADPAPGCRKVIYNQNHFYTFSSVAREEYPHWRPQPALWVSSSMSCHVMRRLRRALGVSTVRNVPCAVDGHLFRPSGARERKVVWMPRKRPNEAALIHALLSADDRLTGVRFAAIDGLSERETADELGNASVFIALGREEGFGLPVAEALLAGCVVVGYPAGGGAELFEGPGAYAVADSDVLAIVDRVAAVLAEEPPEEERTQYRTRIAQAYSNAGLLEELKRAVASVFEQPGAAGNAIHPWPHYQRIHGAR